MELATELFDAILGALGPARAEAAPPGIAERRRDKRIAVACDVMMAPFGVASARPRKVSLRSVSRSGAAVVDAFTRPPGEKVVIYFPSTEGGLVPIACIIMNTRMTGGEFRLGMQFLSQAEQSGGGQVMRSVRGIVNGSLVQGPLHVLDAIATQGVTRGADAAQPVEVNMHALMNLNVKGQAGPVEFVTVKEISRGGEVSVLAPEEMRKGEQFMMQIPCSQARPLTLLCTVSDSRRTGVNVRIVARFEVKREDVGANGGVFGRLRRWFAA